MMDGKILIVGGYGAVGRVIATKLCSIFHDKVIVAGRNYKKAERFSGKLNGKAAPLELDIASPQTYTKQLDKVGLVVMCIDQSDTGFVSYCIKMGISYIDITANYTLLSKVERLNNEAINRNSTVVLSVGLAPGITNLLAMQCKRKVRDIGFANIFIMIIV